MVEVEDLERVNREDGYAAGDDLIRTAAASAERAAGPVGGTACRYGGARLAVVLPGADENTARAVAGQIAADVDGSRPSLRCSHAVWEPGQSGDDVVSRARVGLRTTAAAAQTADA
jgi:PleD family two-component response regulator